MHIQEGTNTTLTTCTKMTEEVDRRHGVNGNSSSKAVSEDATVHNSLNATGGRLKFFKDGKFILELVRGCAREGGGGGGGWVSVPRKTFWPPAGAPPPGTPPAPPPLSVSDDNSSLHSSPWQRDHCWKQQAPRKNLSKELALYYCRPATLTTAHIQAVSRARRRRPFEPAPPALNGHRNGDADDEPPDDRELYYRMKLKKHQYRQLRVYRKTRPRLRRKLLARAVARLAERAPPAPVNAKLAHCRQEHAIVSPRKRILRELERVSLEDGSKRRARSAPQPAPPLSTQSYPAPPGPSHAPPKPGPAPAKPAKHVSSYSIHSLLSMGEEPPAPPPPSSPCSVPSPAPSPSPEPSRYRYGAGAGAGGGFPRWAGAEVPYVYGYGYGYLPGLYRAPPPLWMQYVPPAPAPSPWAPLALPLLTDHIPKDEPTSDLPLNLSKH